MLRDHIIPSIPGSETETYIFIMNCPLTANDISSLNLLTSTGSSKKYIYVSHRKCAKLYWYSRDMRRLMPFAHVCSRYGRSAYLGRSIYSIHAFLTAKAQDRWQHVANMNQMNQKVRTGCGMWNIKGPSAIGLTGPDCLKFPCLPVASATSFLFCHRHGLSEKGSEFVIPSKPPKHTWRKVKMWAPVKHTAHHVTKLAHVAPRATLDLAIWGQYRLHLQPPHIAQRQAGHNRQLAETIHKAVEDNDGQRFVLPGDGHGYTRWYNSTKDLVNLVNLIADEDRCLFLKSNLSSKHLQPVLFLLGHPTVFHLHCQGN